LQEALYESIGPARRRRYHLRIAQVIEKLYASRLEGSYESLAYHFHEGNDLEKAVIYSHRAGVKAASHCAYREAVLYFEQALGVLEHLPEGRQKLEQAIAIRIDLGPALIAIGSYLAPEVEENYIQAEKLCERLGESAQLFPVLWTLSRIRHWGGELLAARQLAEQLLSLARREQDSLRLLEAHHTLWAISLDIGELPSTKGYAEQGFMLYDRVRHGQIGSVYGGHDPGGVLANPRGEGPMATRLSASSFANNRGCTDHGNGAVPSVHFMVGPDGCYLDTSSPRGQASCSKPCREAARTSSGAAASTLDKGSKFLAGLAHGRAGSMGAGYSADAPG